MDSKKKAMLGRLIENTQASLDQLKKALAEDNDFKDFDLDNLLFEKNSSSVSVGNHTHADRGKIIEGVFDGQGMVGPDGKQYTVPPNYASKSKLVEGDILKLTIAPDGTFVYKQIQPVERERLVGSLVKDKETEDFKALVGKKIYKLLLASVTYFKGDVGDEVVILVPKEGKSSWAAVENIIKS